AATRHQSRPAPRRSAPRARTRPVSPNRCVATPVRHPARASDPWQDQTPKLLYGRLSWSIDSYRSFLMRAPRHAPTGQTTSTVPIGLAPQLRKPLTERHWGITGSRQGKGLILHGFATSTQPNKTRPLVVKKISHERSRRNAARRRRRVASRHAQAG